MARRIKIIIIHIFPILISFLAHLTIGLTGRNLPLESLFMVFFS